MTKLKDTYNVTHSTGDIYTDSFYEALEKSKKQYEEKTNTKTFPDSIVTSVRQEMLERASKGFLKYDETLDRTDLSVIDYLQHAKEEAMDLALYLEKTIQMLQGKK